MLSGNRNFEGRINQDVKANYLASPPLVVAYALAGRMDVDLDHEPLGEGSDGEPVYLRDVWPDAEEIKEVVGDSVPVGDVRAQLRARSSPATRAGTRSRSPPATATPGPTRPTSAAPASSSGCRPRRPGSSRSPAPGCSPCSATRSPPTTSHPAGAIKSDSPAGQLADRAGRRVADFNSYGSRRGNHEVMIRGTFANIRLRNQLVERAGGYTRHFPDGEETTIYEAAMEYAERRRAARRPGRQGVRLRLLPRLGGQGHASCSACAR